MSRTAYMPGSCRYPYRRVAVVEVEGLGPDEEPAMISDRARHVVRVVRTWEKLPAGGTTPRSALQRALAEAESLCAELNEGGRDD